MNNQINSNRLIFSESIKYNAIDKELKSDNKQCNRSEHKPVQMSSLNLVANFVPFLGKYKIIDAHGHINLTDKAANSYKKFGKDELTPDSINKAVNVPNPPGQDELEITHVAISNLTGLYADSHNPGEPSIISPKEASILAMKVCKDQNEKSKPHFLALLSCDPNPSINKYGNVNQRLKDIEELILSPDNKFYGLKFHPYHNNTDANSGYYDKYMELARKYDLPCFFHCAPDEHSNPLKTIELAKKYSDVPVILYHINLASDMYHYDQAVEKASDAINNDGANIYLELSWVDNLDRVMKAIRDAGEDRVIFGTDTSLGPMADPVLYRERIISIMNKIRETYNKDKAEEIIQKIFFENSKKIFKLENTDK
ncbi:MAG: amidohydrolase family protein [Cyanobacteriota bacterium]